MCLCDLAKAEVRLQTLVYDILPPATVIIDYAIGLEKLSANGQFFVGAHAQLAVSFQRTTESISGVTFVTAHVAYVSTNKTKIVSLETELSLSLSLST